MTYFFLSVSFVNQLVMYFLFWSKRLGIIATGDVLCSDIYCVDIVEGKCLKTLFYWWWWIGSSRTGDLSLYLLHLWMLHKCFRASLFLTILEGFENGIRIRLDRVPENNMHRQSLLHLTISPLILSWVCVPDERPILVPYTLRAF